MRNEYVEFNTLQGLRLERVRVNADRDEVTFVTDGGTFRMWHEQDCCESVSVEDVVGDLRDLEGQIVTTAEESVSSEDGAYGSQTWTFYRIVTPKGDVTIRWCGESNGYYSESVSFARQ